MGTEPTQRILYLGAPWDAGGAERSIPELFAATGRNTGNLLIGDAIRRHLTSELVRVPLDTDPAAIERDFDRIVIGASNFIFGRFDLWKYADFLERVRLPCVIIGLGAQAPTYGSKVEVPEGTRRMLLNVSERSTSLGVRGYFTARTLIDMGIRNVRVIGCPSMYWTCEPMLRVSRAAGGRELAVAVNGSADVIEHASDAAAARVVEGRLARLAFARGYPYILQSERILMTATPDSEFLGSLMTLYGMGDLSVNDFLRFVRKTMRVYFNVAEWRDAMRKFDLVIGTRFHGCLIGLLAGVPSFVFVHDTRTREMCELLHIPHTSVTDAADIDPRRLIESLDHDAFETAYRYLFQNYIQFLDENGLGHRLHPMEITASEATPG